MTTTIAVINEILLSLSSGVGGWVSVAQVRKSGC